METLLPSIYLLDCSVELVEEEGEGLFALEELRGGWKQCLVYAVQCVQLVLAVYAVCSLCSVCAVCAVPYLKGCSWEKVAVSEVELNLDVDPVGLEHWDIGSWKIGI